MKRLLLLASSAAFSGIAAFAQTPKIIVQGSGTPQVFTSLADAVTAATATDIIYMSGGDFNLNGTTVNIDHEVHIVGAGISPDSASITLPTHIQNGTVSFYLPASNCTVTGVEFGAHMHYGQGNDAEASVQDMLFTRCAFDYEISAPAGATSTTTFEQCLLWGGFNAFYMPNQCVVNNSIVGNALYVSDGEATFINCDVLASTLGGIANFNLQNCIVASTGGAITSNEATWTNCLTYNVSLLPGSVTLNCANSPSNPFMSNADIFFQWADDLNLAAGNPGIGLGTDATDAGIYGGGSWKPGAVPYNPHYYHVDIAPVTDGNGDLPVNITVARQTN
jgi:hypothetical protein